jgi:predicted amidohydrolase
MVEPYTAVAISPTTVSVGSRDDITRNLKRATELMDIACMYAATEGAPPRLVVIPEMCLQGALRNFRGGDRGLEAELFAEIPGAETEVLGAKARELDAYVVGELYLVRDDDFPDRYFNVAFVIDPRGEVICKRAKVQLEDIEPPSLGTTAPHDLWDAWIERKGNGNPLDAFFPVARTEIGNIGVIICHEGGYPEIARGLAMNGAEILVHHTYQEPFVSNGCWELQNRAHAMFNNAYVIAPNVGPFYLEEGGYPVDVAGGQSMIVDHRGNVVVKQPGTVAMDSFVSTIIDLEALRKFRIQSGFSNWFKDLRTEQFRLIYDQPIYPKNQYLDDPPALGWWEREAATRAKCIRTLEERGVLVAPDRENGVPDSSPVVNVLNATGVTAEA